MSIDILYKKSTIINITIFLIGPTDINLIYYGILKLNS